MRRMRRAWWIIAALLLAARPVAAAASLQGWAAVVISGDNEGAHVRSHTEAFDNARRDLSRTFERLGVSPANLAQFSVEPDRHPDAAPARLDDIARTLRGLASRARDGCLVYLTSHGSEDGAVLGDRLLAPAALAGVVDGACGSRPSVVVVSACYSGVFVPALAEPDRLVITAARRDRSSFGCGESDKYPFFDQCVLESAAASPDFVVLGKKARACVARRERAEGMRPPSEPQIDVGARFHSPEFAGRGGR